MGSDRLMDRTEGWPAGLYLAALSLRAQPSVDVALSRFAGDDQVVADYLRDELMARLEPDHVDFLLRTSILDTLSGPLCDAVLGHGGSGRILATLARSNVLLVSLDRGGTTYRYHPLFREMLHSELRRLDRCASRSYTRARARGTRSTAISTPPSTTRSPLETPSTPASCSGDTQAHT